MEFWGPRSQGLEVVPNAEAAGFLAEQQTALWVFVGRLLRRSEDTATLGDPTALAAVIDDTFRMLRPWWADANRVATGL